MADLDTQVLIEIRDAFSAPLRKLDSLLGGVEQKADKLRKSFELAANLNQAAEAAGRFGNMLAGPLMSSVREFQGFEKEMSKVAALSGEIGTEGFGRMKAQALELGAATAYSSEEAAEAMAQYAQAGRSVNEILEITPMTLAAAKANGTGLAETAAIIGHTMSGMGIATKDTAHTVDVLTAASAASDMTLSDMGQAMAYVAPVARQAGMSLELTAAYLGKLKDAGLEASSAGTGMRAVLTRLLDPSREATRAFSKLGIKEKELVELQKAVASGRPDIALRRIGEAAQKLPNETRMKLLSQIFGMEASTAANIAISTTMDTSVKGLDAAVQGLSKVDGTAERLAGVMGDNLDGAMERASGAVSGLKTQLGELLAPTVSSAAGSVEKLATKMAAWAKENPKAAQASLELVGGVAALSLALKGILLTASVSVSALAGIKTAFAALSGSMLGSAGLVAAAGLAGYAIGDWAEKTFDISEKINALLGNARGFKVQAKQGIGAGPQVYAGGWEMEGNKVLKMGTGPGPKAVQEAMAAGETTAEGISGFIQRKHALDDVNARPPPAEPSKEAAAAAAAAAVEPKAEEFTSSHLTKTDLTDIAMSKQTLALVLAQREQTDALAETLRKTEKNTRDMTDEMRKSRTTRPIVTGVQVY